MSWVFERSSGYAGYRNEQTGKWIYQEEHARMANKKTIWVIVGTTEDNGPEVIAACDREPTEDFTRDTVYAHLRTCLEDATEQDLDDEYDKYTIEVKETKLHPFPIKGVR